MPRTAIHVAGAKPVPVPLSPGIRKGNILQVAGQIPADPATGEIVGGTVDALAVLDQRPIMTRGRPGPAG